MSELVEVKREQAMCSSLDVAKKFHKQHKTVIRSIENMICNEHKIVPIEMFIRSSYVDGKGRRYKLYYMNRDGFSLLAMGFTGEEALEWKVKYITAFNAMETELKQRGNSKIGQKSTMQFLQDNLQMPEGRDFVKANTIADKCISTMLGYPKMVKKRDIPSEALEKRDEILKDTAELMAAKEKYNLDISISKTIYQKHIKHEVTA